MSEYVIMSLIIFVLLLICIGMIISIFIDGVMFIKEIIENIMKKYFPKYYYYD